MKIKWTTTFTNGYHKLSTQIQKRFKEKFRLFVQNPKHPSLGVKKIEGTKNIYEARINKQFRWTFEPIEDGIKMRHIGTHKILKNP